MSDENKVAEETAALRAMGDRGPGEDGEAQETGDAVMQADAPAADDAHNVDNPQDEQQPAVIQQAAVGDAQARYMAGSGLPADGETPPLRPSARNLYRAGSGEPVVAGGGEGDDAPSVPPFVVPVDHVSTVQHIKDWVRRELALAHGGLEHGDRVAKNP